MFKQKFISKRVQEAFGEPVGDPFGGPAYGQRTFFGLALGAISVFQGASAIAAGVSGLAAIAAGAAIVGGALSVIGNLTGDANLSKIGGIIGLGGAAIGAFSGDGFFGEMFSDAFGGGSAAAMDSGILSQTSAGIGPTADVAAGMDFNFGGAASVPVSMPQAPAVVDVGAAVGGMPQITPQAPASTGVEWGMYGDTGVAPSIVDQGGTAASDAIKAADATQAWTPTTVDGGDPIAYGTEGSASSGITNATQASGGLLGGINDFLNKNGKLVEMAGGFLKGSFGPEAEKTKALIDRYNAETTSLAEKSQIERELLAMKQRQEGRGNSVVAVAPMATGTGNVTRNQTGLLAPHTRFAA